MGQNKPVNFIKLKFFDDEEPNEEYKNHCKIIFKDIIADVSRNP